MQTRIRKKGWERPKLRYQSLFKGYQMKSKNQGI